MDTETTVTVAGREIQQMPDGTWYYLDTRPGKARAEFVSIRWGDSLRRRAYVRAHSHEYVCVKADTRWQCGCKGFANHGTCYHVITLQGAERILAGERRQATKRRPSSPACLAHCL